MNSVIEKCGHAPKRVFVVDDHPVIRNGIAALLADELDLSFCGEAEDVFDAIRHIQLLRPDLVIVDVALKKSNGFDLVKRLTVKHPSIRILVFSMYPEVQFAERSLRAGAHGYVCKTSAPSELTRAMRAVLSGSVYFSRTMSEILLSKLSGTNAQPKAYTDTLTDRELQTFLYMGQSLSTCEIAKRLHVSASTVDTYRARIRRKLQICNGAELLQRAIEWSMVCASTKDE